MELRAVNEPLSSELHDAGSCCALRTGENLEQVPNYVQDDQHLAAVVQAVCDAALLELSANCINGDDVNHGHCQEVGGRQVAQNKSALGSLASWIGRCTSRASLRDALVASVDGGKCVDESQRSRQSSSSPGCENIELLKDQGVSPSRSHTVSSAEIADADLIEWTVVDKKASYLPGDCK